MKTMATSLGIEYEAEPSTEVVTATPTDITVAPTTLGEETNYEDLDDIILKSKNFGLSLMESAASFELGNQPRIYEVANQLLGTTIAAIKAKHAYEFKHKDLATKKSTAGAAAQSNTQINNFFGNREDLLKLMEKMNKDTL